MKALRTQYGDLRDSLAIPSDTNWGWEWELGLDKGGYPGLGKGGLVYRYCYSNF